MYQFITNLRNFISENVNISIIFDVKLKIRMWRPLFVLDRFMGIRNGIISGSSGVSLIAVGDDDIGVTWMRVGGDPVAQQKSMSSRVIAIRKAILRTRPAGRRNAIMIKIDSLDDDDRF